MQTKSLFNKIITGHETWCFAYDPETKRQSCEWVGETSPRPKKLKFQRSHIKKMLIIFFDSPGVVHKEFVLEGKMVMLLFNAVGEYFKIAVFWNVGRFVSRRAYRRFRGTYLPHI